MPVECLDLKALFGDKYRVKTDVSSYQADYGDSARRADPRLLVIPCKHGEIFPHGGQQLAASTRCRGKYAKRLAALPCCRMWQDGDDGVTVLFDVADFEAVAVVMQPKRRRRWSPEQRERMLAGGHLFTSGAAR